MNARRVLPIALVVVAAALAARAQEPSSPKGIIERAVAFHGGAKTLAALPNLESHGMLETSGRWGARSLPFVHYDRGDGSYRNETTFERRGRKTTVVEFYDGKICKRRFGTSWDDLPLDEPRERAAHRITFLLAALDRTATAAGEGTEAGAEVVRVQVPDGRGQATLSLAKDDGRLVAMEFPGIEADGMGTKKEVVRKLVFRDVKKVGAVLVPFDVELFKDGSPDGRIRYERIELLKEFDEAWLQVPDPRRRFIPSDELAN